MSAPEFALGLLQALIWPLVFVGVVIWLRKPIRKWVDHVREVEASLGPSSLTVRTAQIERELTDVLASATRDGTSDGDEGSRAESAAQVETTRDEEAGGIPGSAHAVSEGIVPDWMLNEDTDVLRRVVNTALAKGWELRDAGLDEVPEVDVHRDTRGRPVVNLSTEPTRRQLNLENELRQVRREIARMSADPLRLPETEAELRGLLREGMDLERRLADEYPDSGLI